MPDYGDPSWTVQQAPGFVPTQPVVPAAGEGAEASDTEVTAAIAVHNAAAGAHPGVKSPFIFGVPAAPVADGALAANQIAFWSNDGSNLLAFKMKNSAGVVKTGTVALT